MEPDKIEIVKAMDDIVEVRKAATELGVKFSGNTGIDTLKSKVIEHLEEAATKPESDTENKTQNTDPTSPITPADVGADVKPAEAPVNSPTPSADASSNFLVSEDEKDEEIEVAKVPARGPSIEELLEMDATKVEDPKLRRMVVRAKALRLHRVVVTNLDPADAQLSGAIVTAYNKYTGKVSKYVPFDDVDRVGYHVPEILVNQMKNQKFNIRKQVKGGSFGVKRYVNTKAPKFQIDKLEPLTEKELEALALRQNSSN